jgi:hypothetical protein
MASNIFDELKNVYVNEVIEPKLGKKDSSPESSSSSPSGSDSSEKKIRQAVYDIRYRARREDVPLEQAFGQYMSNTSMSSVEKDAVKEKLGMGPGKGQVKEESEHKKYKVRVTDKNSGKSYVRMATREKINSLRGNPNISSVEMTSYGEPYEGEKSKGKSTAKVTSGKGLDPVGREDKDIDNDGDHDKSDKYLLNRRKARGAAISKQKVKEEFYNWRQELFEVADEIENTEDKKKISEKKVKNKVVINPKLSEEVDEDQNNAYLIECEEISKESAFSQFDCILEDLTDSEVYFLSDDLIEEVVYEVFYECLDEGYEINEIEEVLTESLDISYELINEKVDMTARAAARKQYAAASEKSAKEARKRGADVVRKEKRAEKIQKIKDTVKKVSSSIKSGVKSASKKAIHGASYVAGKASTAAKKVGSAASSAGEKAKEVAGKVSATAKAGYKAGKGESDSEESSKGTYRIKYKTANTKKKDGFLSKVGSHLKKNLKKAVGKTSRLVSKGADKLAARLGEENINEVSPPTAKSERMVKHIKKSYAKDGELTDKEKAIAYATAWKQYNKTQNEAVDQKIQDQPTKSDDNVRSKQSDAVKKQQLQNLKMIQQKKQMLDRNRLQMQKSGKLPLNTEEVELEEKDDPCWKGYTQVGMKKKGGREVPNCVPSKGVPKAKGYKKEEVEIEEGMDMKDFKSNRTKLKRREASADAEKRGHVGKEWYNSGRKYSPDEAKRSRANMDDEERRTRHRSAVDPDNEDDNNYSADKTKNPKKLRKQKAMGEQTLHELNRAEKETGINTKTGKPTAKGGAKDDKAFTHVKRMIRGMEGKPAGQRKKVPGKKPPAAGQYGAPASPAQKVAQRRAAAKRAQDNMSSRFD